MTEIRNARSSVRVAFQGATTIVRLAAMQLRVLNSGGGELRLGGFQVRVLSENRPGVFVKTWTGSAFVDAPVKVWDGSAFVDPVGVKTWNGTSFV